MRYRAYAKVNLSLEIVNRRPDGYHDIASLMQTVSVFDDIELADRSTIHFDCSEPELDGEQNLVVRAAHRIRSELRRDEGCGLSLYKRIPHGAGLGGGSSDAAVTLRALNERWALHLSPLRLAELGSELGSDVPFFLYGGTCFVTGRGEQVRPLPDPKAVWYVLIKPPFSVPTAEIFGKVVPSDFTDGSVTRSLVAGVCATRELALGLNGLQRALFESFPGAREYYDAVFAAAPGRTFVSGSGPTIGVLCSSRHDAEQVRASVGWEDCWTTIAHSVGRRHG